MGRQNRLTDSGFIFGTLLNRESQSCVSAKDKNREITMVSATNGFIYALCVFIVVWVILRLQFSIKKLEQKVKRMEISLSLLLNRMEIEVPSLVSDQVKQLALDPHRKIEAIKLYRGETGASLLEAKEAIEEFIKQNQERWS